MTRRSVSEADRQQWLLRALWRQLPADRLAPHLRNGARLQRGLQAYQAHAGAQAQRALAAAYPTVMALVSEDSFAGLARALWLQYPPAQGDLAQWGQAFADFMETLPDLADEPYLGDVARLEWAVHRARTAADHDRPPSGLQRLADPGAEALTVQLRPGTAVVASHHPVCSLWQVHQPTGAAADAEHEDGFTAVRQALAAGLGETAWVYRKGFDVQVQTLPPQDTAFAVAVLAGQPLGQALQAADDHFNFEPWLHAGLRDGWLVGMADPVEPR